MKEIVLNYFAHIESTVVQQLGMATAAGHHADAAQTQDAVHSDAIALRARELHAVADTMTDMLALVRVVRANLLAELETEGAPALSDAVRAKLEDVRDALITIREIGTVWPKDLTTGVFGDMRNLRALTAVPLALLESLGVPLPAEVPAEAKQRLETAHARVQADHTDRTDRTDRGEASVTNRNPQP